MLRALSSISANLSTDNWCLVGGMMVLIASRTTDRTVQRAEGTRDGDLLVDICASPTILARVVNQLKSFGFQPIERFKDDEFGRCTFLNDTGDGQIDVLCPDDADPVALDSVEGVRSLAIPGGRRALELSEEVQITYEHDAQDFVIRVPLLPAAIVVKAAAALDERTSDQSRHIQDVASLLSVLADPLDAQRRLEEPDLALIARLRPRIDDDGDVAWDRFSEDTRREARAAFELLTR